MPQINAPDIEIDGAIARGKILVAPKDEKYSDGFHNHFTRLYFYTQKGLGLLNEFKNLILVIIAGYYALKLDNILWMGVMFVAALPLLTLLGWYCVHYMSKVMDWLSIRHGTFYAVRQFALFEEIRDLLKKLNDK